MNLYFLKHPALNPDLSVSDVVLVFVPLQVLRSSPQRTTSVRSTSTTSSPNSSPTASSNRRSLTPRPPPAPVSPTIRLSWRRLQLSPWLQICLPCLFLFVLFFPEAASSVAPAAPPTEEEEEEEQEVEEGDVPDLTSFSIDDMKQ